MKAKFKEDEVFFKTMMNHIPNNIIRNPKLINVEENQGIKKSIVNGQKNKKDF